MQNIYTHCSKYVCNNVHCIVPEKYTNKKNLHPFCHVLYKTLLYIVQFVWHRRLHTDGTLNPCVCQTKPKGTTSWERDTRGPNKSSYLTGWRWEQADWSTGLTIILLTYEPCCHEYVVHAVDRATVCLKAEKTKILKTNMETVLVTWRRSWSAVPFSIVHQRPELSRAVGPNIYEWQVEKNPN